MIFKEVPVNSVTPCITSQPAQQYAPSLVPTVTTQNHALPEIKEEEDSDSSSDDDTDCEGTAANGQKRTDLKPDFKCYICKSDSLGTAKALTDHLSVHSGLVPQTCTECITEPIVLRDIRALNSHRRMHSQPIKCEYCDRRYGDYHGRDEHVRLYHLGEGAPCPSPCQQCGKICKSVAALKSHMRNHKQDVRYVAHVLCYHVQYNIIQNSIFL